MRPTRRRAASQAFARCSILAQFESFAAQRRRRIQGLSATISKRVSGEKQTKRYFVSGIVQGVGFRFFVRDVAEKLRMGGYTRNLFDGRVEVLAVGSPAQQAELKAALERGPRFSSVSGVQEEDAARSSDYERGFVIESNA